MVLRINHDGRDARLFEQCAEFFKLLPDQFLSRRPVNTLAPAQRNIASPIREDQEGYTLRPLLHGASGDLD